MESWKKHNYQVIWTEDQSPTLQSLTGILPETMHHPGGAYTETQAIYGQPLRWALKQGAASVLSVGLGLGYNEILAMQEALLHQRQDLCLTSFEKDECLIAEFLAFLKNPDLQGPARSEIHATYQKIAGFFGASEDILRNLLQLKESGQWKIESALTRDTVFKQKFQVILYDAYSGKFDDSLWTEEFLGNFLLKAADPNCVLTTYASRGSLKRSLRAAGFEVTLRDGFYYPRKQSILAMRGFKTQAKI